MCLCDTESGAHQLVMPQLITTHTLQFAVNYNIDKTEGNVKEKENTSFRFDVGWGTNFLSVYISRENYGILNTSLHSALVLSLNVYAKLR